MPPMGGGLMQIVAYGAQDCYLNCNQTPIDSIYKSYFSSIEEVKSSKRTYKNFHSTIISWKYECIMWKYDKPKFNETIYNKYCNKYDNLIYLLDVDFSTMNFTMVKGNKELREKLDKEYQQFTNQVKESQIVEEFEEKGKEQQRKAAKINSLKKPSKNHKRFFYGK
jgi:hypothetical protein